MTEQALQDWTALNARIADCQACALGASAIRKVPGQGDRHAPLMLIGEGPGQREDEEGLAFVGAAGQLLTKLLLSVGLPRDRVYICNIVKCRPPHNRVPEDEEAAACAPLLDAQIALVHPKVIVLLGSTAAKRILGPDTRITRDRGHWYTWKGMWLMPTFHPSALLRDESKLGDAERDMAAVRARLWELGLYGDLPAYARPK